MILPASLRRIFHLLRGGDHAYGFKVIRVTLTLLSVYRVLGCAPILKLSTITDGFSGLSSTLPVWEVAQVVGSLPRSLVIGRAIWTYVSESAGPNFKKSTWSAGLDAVAFLRDPLVWYHWLSIALAQRAWLLITWNLFTILCCLPVFPVLILYGKFPKYLGRLATLFEARGKVRIVAITDWWTQVLLKPLHLGIFDILRSISQDGTFDQLAPVHSLIAYVRASGAKVFSYDLSAATDRLPIAFQIQVLESLGVRWARNWAALLVTRPWFLNKSATFYAVGQPIGALSSWAMLALSHHFIVQIAARRVGYREWFQHYALLGDDIIIADAAVAGAYLDLMSTLGVPINISKSFEMKSGTCEFAKRWISPTLGDLSPMSPGLILGSLRNPRMLCTLISDSLKRGFIFPTHVERELVRFLHIIRPGNWLRSNVGPILSSVIGPTSGLWDTASGLLYKASWIALFPHSMANRPDDVVSALQDLIADNQKCPPSEDELKDQLRTQFWARVGLFGRNLWGLISLPFVVCSPAFWVYYDLCTKAEESILEYEEKKLDYEQTLLGREWTILEGTSLALKAESLGRLVKSTFDPGLLEWDRLQAELILTIHRSLFKKVTEIVAVDKMRARYVAGFSQQNRFGGFAGFRLVKRTSPQTIPTDRSVVLLGFWSYPFKQVIALKETEIPQPGAPLDG